MRILIVGGGNIAHWLLANLINNEDFLVAIHVRSVEKQSIIKKVIPKVHLEPNLDRIDGQYDVAILAVSDTQITQVIKQQLKHTVLVHCSGATGIDVLATQALHYGALWPIYSITEEKAKHVPNDIPIIISANSEVAQEKIIIIAHNLSSNLTKGTDEQRLLLHLGATVVNNFTNHLYDLTQRFLRQQQMDMSLLKPIMVQQANQIPQTTIFSDNQTGAAIRKDFNTITKHQSLIQKFDDPIFLDLYNSLTQSIINHNKTK